LFCNHLSLLERDVASYKVQKARWDGSGWRHCLVLSLARIFPALQTSQRHDSNKETLKYWFHRKKKKKNNDGQHHHGVSLALLDPPHDYS
jgi:hypothetical protein